MDAELLKAAIGINEIIDALNAAKSSNSTEWFKIGSDALKIMGGAVIGGLFAYLIHLSSMKNSIALLNQTQSEAKNARSREHAHQIVESQKQRSLEILDESLMLLIELRDSYIKLCASTRGYFREDTVDEVKRRSLTVGLHDVNRQCDLLKVRVSYVDETNSLRDAIHEANKSSFELVKSYSSKESIKDESAIDVYKTYHETITPNYHKVFSEFKKVHDSVMNGQDPNN